jgi:hypothetical protein
MRRERPTEAATLLRSSDYTTYELDQVSVHDRVVPKERVLPAEPAVPIRKTCSDRARTTSDHLGPPRTTSEHLGPPRTTSDHFGQPLYHLGPPRTTSDHPCTTSDHPCTTSDHLRPCSDRARTTQWQFRPYLKLPVALRLSPAVAIRRPQCSAVHSA